MDEFKQLLAVADRLLGPGGCPWDLEQTLFTLQSYLLEETHELIEAIDEGKAHKISEELGDVLYALIFIAKLGEKEGSFTLSGSIKNVAEKLIRRHPHVFGEKIVESSDDVVRNWEEIKKQEGKKNPIEGIPPTLPALARAQKVIHKLLKAKSPLVSTAAAALSSEEELGQKLWDLIREADMKGYDAESALRRTSQSYEEKFKKGL